MKFPHLKSPLTYKLQLPAAADMQAILEQHPFHDLTEHQLHGHGFVADPITGELVTPLTDHRSGYWVVMKYAERIIPGAVLKQKLDSRVKEIEAEQLRKVYAKERRELKDDMLALLTPTALVRERLVYGFYHAFSGFLFVSGANGRLASLFTGELVRLLGAVKAETIHYAEVTHGLTARLLTWLRSDVDPEGAYEVFGGMGVGGLVHISVPGNRATATKIVADDLGAPSLGLEQQISGGYLVDKLELSLEGTSFYFDRNFRVSGLVYPANSLDGDDLPYACRQEATVRVLNLVYLMTRLSEMLIPAKPAEDCPAPAGNEVDDLV